MKKYFLFLSLIINFNLISQTYTAPTTGILGSFAGGCDIGTNTGTYVDNGGVAGNYSLNINNIYQTICPTTAGQSLRLTFTSFDMENGWDYIVIGNGPAQNSTVFTTAPAAAGTGVITGTPTVPFSYTATNSSGCLTVRVYSDNINTGAGFQATITTVNNGTALAAGNSDCSTSTFICSNTAFNDVSNGPGISPSEGCAGSCLTGEVYSNWYTFSIMTSGTLSLNINPVTGTDDFDFAVYGPSMACGAGAPVRCSFAGTSGTTGLGNGAVDNSEGAAGDGWVSQMNVTAGESYQLLVNNWSPGGTGFGLTFGGTATIGTPAPTINSATVCGVQSTTLTATPVVPGGTYLWSPGGQTTQSITVSPASTTTYSCVYTVNSCTSASGSGTITVNTVPTAPVIGAITQPTCTVATGSVALSGLPAAGAWTVTASPGGATLAGSGPTTTGTFSGLTAGTTYTFTVTNASGCTSVASSNAIINTQPATPTAPVIGAITQPTCTVATASVALSGLPAVGAWTVTASPGGATLAGSGPTTTGTFSGLTASTTYTFTVTNASGCTSVASSNAVINAQPSTPTTPVVGAITQPTCSVPTGSVALSGLPAVGAWTVTASPGGATLAGSGPTTTGTFSGLTASTTYTFTVTNASGCTSVASSNAVIGTTSSPSAPIIGTITQPTCTVATGSVDLSGLPAAGAWTVTATPGGATLAGSGPTTTGTFPGLTAGTTYTFTVTDVSGCVSVASSNVVINAQPSTPTAPVIGAITQPTCTVATGSVALSGLPAVGAWTVTAAPGGATLAGSGPTTTGTFSGLTASTTYTFTVTNASGCTSVSSSNAVINAQPTTPTTPVVGAITQPTCTVATGSVDLSGLPVAGAWTVTATPGGATLAGSGPTTTGTFPGLTAGTTYTFTVTNASGCTSVASSNAVINAQPTTPTAPIVGAITQPTCTVATGSVDLSGLPAAGAWTVTATPGGATLAGSGPTTTGTFPGLTAGTTYTFTVTNASGCTSVASSNVVINAQPTTPTAPVIGAITQPTCTVATGSVDLSGLPAAGAWTVTATPGGATLAGSGPTTTGTFSGLTASTTYTFTVTNASGCTSVASSNVVINAQPTTSSAPVIGTITQPTCTVATGSIDLSGLPAVGAWTVTITPGGGTLAGSGPTTTGTFSGLTAGTTYTFTVANASGCTSVASSNAVINAQPTTPTAPVIGAITQPTCTVATGSVDLSGLPVPGAWTITATPGGTTLAGSGATATFPGLTASTTYTFTVTNASGCTSVASSNAVINAQPSTPTAPVVGTITQPNCTLITGSVDLSGLPAVGAWTITATPGGATLAGSGPTTTGTFSGLTAGVTYTFTVTNASGCTSVASSTVDLVDLPPNPTIFGSLDICVGASHTLTGTLAPNATTPWASSNTGIATITSGGVLTGTGNGTCTITYLNGLGCSTDSIVTVYANPTITGSLVICEGETVQLTGSGTPNASNPWISSLPATASVSSLGEVTGLTAGITSITYTDSNGCAAIVNETVNPTPASPVTSADTSYCSVAVPVNIQAIAGSGGTLTWYSDATLNDSIGTGTSLTPSMNVGVVTYYVTETVGTCVSPSSSVTLTITLCSIDIPTAFTPDGNAVNDTWELEFIDKSFPLNVVKIYDRWGSLIYESAKGTYETKPWDGNYKGSALPVASYYFIIEYNDGITKPDKGTVTIVRK